jgi:hypothetical protein
VILQKAIHARCLHLEWDIVPSVHRWQTRFNPPPKLLHVKGYQDKLPSLLNINADKLATMDLQEYCSVKPLVPFNPLCGVQLNINGHTVTCQLA